MNTTETMAQPVIATGSKNVRKVKGDKQKQDRWRTFWIGAILPVSVLVIWQAAGMLGFVSKTLLPTPFVIAQSFWELGVSGELFKHLQISIYRAAVGFLLGGGLGL